MTKLSFSHSYSLAHTVGATVSTIAIYPLLMMLVLLVLGLYDLLAGPVVTAGHPTIYEKQENPTVLMIILRAGLTSGVAAFGSFFFSSKIFTKANPRWVVIIFAAFTAYLCLNILGSVAEPRYGFAVETLSTLAIFLPTAYFSYQAWCGEFFKYAPQ